MKIKKIISDSKPIICNQCPMCNMTDKCGEEGHTKFMGIDTFARIPDERCLIEVEK